MKLGDSRENGKEKVKWMIQFENTYKHMSGDLKKTKMSVKNQRTGNFLQQQSFLFSIATMP